MTIALLSFYLLAHAMGFAGMAMILFLCIYEKDIREVRYLAFLVSFFLYVGVGHVAFFSASFSGNPTYFREAWYFAAYELATAILMAAYSVMFHALPKTKQSGRKLARLIAYSCLPLVLLAAGFAPIFGGDSAGGRILIMRLSALSLVLLLAYSMVFMARNLKNAVDAECAMMMRFTITANALLIVPFLAENWYNYDASHPCIPLSAESAYYFALAIANVGWLAQGVMVKRKKKAVEVFSAREAYALAALSPDSLGEREKSILAYLILGLGNKQIAAHLEITEFMVRNHISALLKKSGARNRVELVELYRKTLTRQ
ncbi:MAG TPA: LuxR C-terminal-related transcriptional regulator [Treponemataceae bacterium]|nr:LuxR C-terminal-related transcriptional regulator [Treponemataceae bacterium]HPS45130.1 LuxR C-terminal-related transcriptional regulator [Treponemataceae bacterium]